MESIIKVSSFLPISGLHSFYVMVGGDVGEGEGDRWVSYKLGGRWDKMGQGIPANLL